ncbi:alpha-tocopherol transfer protein-like [Condylostylus longicornis]|uniref:alpha-tocopherol transfer protein-like n=1 Tax=Condylostylus longicornis TaxID=2530218 RepID=UPI00244E08D1|nr:alpha-tocopherol transfer protein-like [Condylostylus longicornis]
MVFALAIEQYKKNKELSSDEISKLLEWIKQQPHLPEVTELEAILFLHSCYYSMQLAKQTVDTYFTMRTHVPELFSGINFEKEDLKTAMKIVSVFPNEKTTPEGHRIFFGKLANFDATHFHLPSCLKLFFTTFDLSLRENGTAPGHIIILDHSGVTLGHVARLAPLVLKKFIYYLQDASPIRIVGFHFVNIVPFSDKILALVRPFMKKELIDVLHLHNKLDGLDQFVPLEILPTEYGGKEGPAEEMCARAYQNAIKNQNFFEDLEKRKVNENVRPGKPKDASDLFGIEGSFKQLSID